MPDRNATLSVASASPRAGIREVAASVKSKSSIALRVNASWLLIGRMAYHATQFALLIALARLASTETVGTYVLSLAVVSPIMMFASLQLHVAQCAYNKGEFEFQEYLALRLLCLLVANLIILVVCLWTSCPLVILAMALAKSAESFSELLCGRLQHLERMSAIARSLMLRGSLSLLVATIALACTHKLELAILAIGLCHLGVAWFHDLPQSLSASRLRDLWRSLRGVSMSRVYQLGWLTFPLGIAYGLAALEISAPRFVVQSQLGERELGILGVMIYVTMIGQLVVASVAHAAIPRMAKCSARGDLKAVRKLVLKVVAIGACAGLGTVVFAWLFGDLFLRVVFSVEYAAYQPLLVAVSVAASFSFVSAMLSTSLRALQFFRSVCILHAIGFIIIMGTCWYTVSQHGLNGAALGMVVSAALTSLLFGGAFLLLMGLRTRELKYA